MNRVRCPWVPVDRPLYQEYHDTEWGVPVFERRSLFEMLCLEGAQGGLSWWTVLQKRSRYRQAFLEFEPEKVAKMSDAELESLVLDPGLIRHRGKIFSVRANARAWLALEARGLRVEEWLWSFTGGTPKVNGWSASCVLPTQTPESVAMSRALRKVGFNFVGSTTLYAFMQAVGMVNDHVMECSFRRVSA
jgi:DNA-3-methyladenine glycosylase I